jgi:hypothetical protein
MPPVLPVEPGGDLGMSRPNGSFSQFSARRSAGRSADGMIAGRSHHEDSLGQTILGILLRSLGRLATTLELRLQILAAAFARSGMRIDAG